MSIAPSFYADYADKKRKEWLAALKKAYAEKRWNLVAKLIEEMDKFIFSE